jgi:TM2 domain-containing membrane protein YozV
MTNPYQPYGQQQPQQQYQQQYQQPQPGGTNIYMNAGYQPVYGNVKRINAIAYLLFAIFLGGIGVHRFYRGSIGMGILYIFTGGLFGIGWLVDIIYAIIWLTERDPNDEILFVDNQYVRYDGPRPGRDYSYSYNYGYNYSYGNGNQPYAQQGTQAQQPHNQPYTTSYDQPYQQPFAQPGQPFTPEQPQNYPPTEQ